MQYTDHMNLHLATQEREKQLIQKYNQEPKQNRMRTDHYIVENHHTFRTQINSKSIWEFIGAVLIISAIVWAYCHS